MNNTTKLIDYGVLTAAEYNELKALNNDTVEKLMISCLEWLNISGSAFLDVVSRKIIDGDGSGEADGLISLLEGIEL